MHIADGLISPQTYLPIAVVVVPLWWVAIRKMRHQSDQVLPRLAVFTALALVLNTLMLPLPGGTSGHLIGVSLITLIFGPWMAFLAYSLMLLLQALILGAGGITALPINALVMGFIGAWITWGVFHLTRPLLPKFSIGLATFCSVSISATLIAVILGIQPMIAAAPDGSPLFFPFGLAITFPAIVIPHMFIAFSEAIVTFLIVSHAQRRHWVERYSS
jgi:cobalt/nickel transport system permease protein